MFVFGCRYTEVFGVEVTTAALAAHAASGYPIKIVSKRGADFAVVISPLQIAAQLDTQDTQGAVPVRLKAGPGKRSEVKRSSARPQRN